MTAGSSVGSAGVAASSVQRRSVKSVGGSPDGTYWSGTVSGVASGQIVANCGQSNFDQGFGCIPVDTSGAAATGTPVVGQYFQLWGDLSKLPSITATTIRFGDSKFPDSDPGAAVVADAAAPAGGAAGTFLGLTSTAAANFTPYAETSAWRNRVSANPVIASYSAAAIATQFPNGRSNDAVRATEAGIYDYSHPRFFATLADPVVTLHCAQYCGAPDNGGIPLQIHIPANARPAGGDDSHLDIVQPDGTEISMWGTTKPSADWTGGARLTAANIANCGSLQTGQGWLQTGPGSTAAGYCNGAGVVTAAELAAGQIPHALFVSAECAVGNQYPSQGGATTLNCTNGVGVPLGGREWYDVPCATTRSNGALKPWEQAILCAFNEYGAYLGDVSGSRSGRFTGGITPLLESEEPWNDAAGPTYTSPFAVLQSQGWSAISLPGVNHGAAGKRWFGADPWRPSGVDFAGHMHWLDPCSARGAC